jgi:hypothetical protein
MYSLTLTQAIMTPQGLWNDSGKTYSADSVTAVETTVDANGGSANAVAIDFTAASFQVLALLSDVPCVVTLTGATAINGVSGSTVTLAANVAQVVTALAGNVTAVSVGANTTASGPAGTIKACVLFNS